MIDAQPVTSTRPYLIRALYEWCTDNGLTPYVAVTVDETVQVPREYAKDGEIVLNISMDATSSLVLGNDFIEFKARFAGKAREIMVPISKVIAVYARETGQGMAFPLGEPQGRPIGGVGFGVSGPLVSKAHASEEDGTERGVPSPGLALASDQHGTEPPDPHKPVGVNRPNLTRVK